MRKVCGWTLIELVIVIAIISLLSAVLVPSLTAAKDRARLTACAAAMRNLHVALMSYAASNHRRLPPFTFSSYSGNLPLSGHWGGASQLNDPAVAFTLKGTSCMNLWTLVNEGLISPSRLVCPGAAAELRSGQGSYFRHSFRYSTYCMRLPYSRDLFDTAPNLADRGDTLLGIYGQAAGGRQIRIGMNYQVVPILRTDWTYRTDDDVTCGDGVYNVAEDAMFSDAFWRQEHYEAAGSSPGLQTYPVRQGWCHGRRFNVCYGDGAVRVVRDDGTVEANTVPPGGTVADDGANYATYAERVWQYFDAAR